MDRLFQVLRAETRKGRNYGLDYSVADAWRQAMGSSEERNGTVVKEGWLKKSPPLDKWASPFKAWESRWFVLKVTTQEYLELEYYKDKDSARKDEPKGIIKFGKVDYYEDIIKLCDKKDKKVADIISKHKSENIFTVTSSEGRTFFLISETKEDLESWFDVLQQQLEELGYIKGFAIQHGRGRSRTQPPGPRPREKTPERYLHSAPGQNQNAFTGTGDREAQLEPAAADPPLRGRSHQLPRDRPYSSSSSSGCSRCSSISSHSNPDVQHSPYRPTSPTHQPLVYRCSNPSSQSSLDLQLVVETPDDGNEATSRPIGILHACGGSSRTSPPDTPMSAMSGSLKFDFNPEFIHQMQEEDDVGRKAKSEEQEPNYRLLDNSSQPCCLRHHLAYVDLETASEKSDLYENVHVILNEEQWHKGVKKRKESLRHSCAPIATSPDLQPGVTDSSDDLSEEVFGNEEKGNRKVESIYEQMGSEPAEHPNSASVATAYVSEAAPDNTSDPEEEDLYVPPSGWVSPNDHYGISPLFSLDGRSSTTDTDEKQVRDDLAARRSEEEKSSHNLGESSDRREDLTEQEVTMPTETAAASLLPDNGEKRTISYVLKQEGLYQEDLVAFVEQQKELLRDFSRPRAGSRSPPLVREEGSQQDSKPALPLRNSAPRPTVSAQSPQLSRDRSTSGWEAPSEDMVMKRRANTMPILHSNEPPPLPPRDSLVPSPSILMAAIIRQQKNSAGVHVTLSSAEVINKLSFVECFSAVWIAGWKEKEAPTLKQHFYVGDNIYAINDQRVKTAADANRTIQMSMKDKIVFLVKRLPHADVVTLRRTTDGEKLGVDIKTNHAEITAVDPDGLAAQQGMKPKYSRDNYHVNWTITMINSLPVSILGVNEKEVQRRIWEGGLQLTLVLQPSDFIKTLRKELKATKNPKEFEVDTLATRK